MKNGLLCNLTPLIQKNLNGDIIKEWNSVNDVLNSGIISKTHLYRVIKRGMAFNKSTWHYKGVKPKKSDKKIKSVFYLTL